jgi:hypothetical protein
MTCVEAFVVSSKHKGYQEKTDAIHIYLNYQDYAEVKSNAEAIKILDTIEALCPAELKREFEVHKSILR